MIKFNSVLALKKKFISGSENNMEIDQNLFLYENA